MHGTQAVPQLTTGEIAAWWHLTGAMDAVGLPEDVQADLRDRHATLLQRRPDLRIHVRAIIAASEPTPMQVWAESSRFSDQADQHDWVESLPRAQQPRARRLLWDLERAAGRISAAVFGLYGQCCLRVFGTDGGFHAEPRDRSSIAPEAVARFDECLAGEPYAELAMMHLRGRYRGVRDRIHQMVKPAEEG